jgi:transcriptional regulator with XRE-family HTH domain
MSQEELIKHIGLNIKKLREEKKVSQQQLACLCDFEKSNMSRIESERTNPTVGTLYKISKELGVNIVELFI